MKPKSLEKLISKCEKIDDYTRYFAKFLKENREISDYISLKNANTLLKNNLHFSPYLKELEILIKMEIPQRYLNPILCLRSNFIDNNLLNGENFYEYILKREQMPEITLPIMATVYTRIGYFHPSLSLASIIKVVSVATTKEALFIFSTLNRISDNPDFYYSFDEYIKSPDVSPSKAYVLLEEYASFCISLENSKSKSDFEKLYPEIFLKDFLNY